MMMKMFKLACMNINYVHIDKYRWPVVFFYIQKNKYFKKLIGKYVTQNLKDPEHLQLFNNCKYLDVRSAILCEICSPPDKSRDIYIF